MLIIATSDWHIRDTKPRNRLDKNYRLVQYNKAYWVLSQARRHNAVVMHGGDILDTSHISQPLLNEYLRLFTDFSDVTVIAAMGQHDQSHHRLDVSGNSVGALFATDLINKEVPDNVVISDWGEDIGENNTEILVTHATITEKPNSIIEGSVSAKEFMQEHDHQLVISGDYHVPHVCEYKGRLLINPGSLMRQNIDQINQRPRVYLVDTDTLEYEVIYVPVVGGNEIFDLDYVKKVKNRAAQAEVMKEAIEKCVDEMSKSDLRPNFRKNLDQVIGKVNPADIVKQKIEEMAA